ncbi:MAG: phosphoenolpyruvate--protein phosphotransferase [Candidatus Omnitrophota bacterium]
MLKGISASGGVAIGKAFIYNPQELRVASKPVSEKELPQEIARFEEALIKTRADILDIQKKISKEMGVEHAEIFNAHLLVLEDRMFIEEVIAQLKDKKLVVEYVFLEVLKRYIKAFSKMEDEYLKERISDIDDVGKRILRNLLGKQEQTLKELKEPVIVVAYDLAPSDTASMHRKHVLAFVTDIGGKTSHTAIMARSLEIPAVVGLEVATKNIRNGDNLIIDGTHGVVEINPGQDTLKHYRAEKAKFEAFEIDLRKLREVPCVTKDGRKIELAANIEIPEETPSVKAHGAEGIGLYRTEFFYMNRNDLPTEEEHFLAYKKVAEQVAPHSIIIRTIDLGGDKFLSQLEMPKEMSSFLGWRAIRFCLARPDIFKVQLRAILRASAFSKVRMMYPMISGVEEIRQANKILEEAKNELRQKKMPFDENIEVGAMIEVPSAALTCDIIAKEVKFLSIGTNDLIQYSLAVDRTNEKVAYLYEPAHPAILRLIKNIVDAGHKENIWVGMCGEMASEPAFALLLLGLGLDEFSVSPVAVPEIKQVIRSVTYEQAKKIAEHSFLLTTGSGVESYIRSKVKELVPGLME